MMLRGPPYVDARVEGRVPAECPLAQASPRPAAAPTTVRHHGWRV
eukprot:CAMPEP_0185554492 /NCGR_PEP_ID=MMETSP1381-20130426/41491_1 /TAXON_ID=298111 /ORGANISM="Pavlova sp., Strain CCMP459" /LENGTH=44 /DNA_ID= /DNA_START= /DNA_END= /DNA_ORIENTATION=